MKKTATILLALLVSISVFGQGTRNSGKAVPGAATVIYPGINENVGIDYLFIEWDPGIDSNAEGYKVYLDENNPPSTLVYDGNSTYFQAQDLELNKEYFWKVVPYNAEGDAVDVPVWNFTTWNYQMFWEEDFMIVEGEELLWTVENHSTSSQQWEFNGLRAQIYTLDDELQTPVWSTMSSPAIDCSGQQNVVLYVNQSVFHDVDFENYYAKVEVSTDGNLWQQAAIIDGNQFRAAKFGFGLPYFEYDISAIADNQPQLFIRVEFNSNGDWNLGWDIDKIGLKGLDLSGSTPEPAVLYSPQNGSNIAFESTYIEWGTEQGAQPDGYRVYLDENNPPSTLIYDGPNTYHYVENLELNKEYFWKVVPYNAEGDAVDVPVWSFTTWNFQMFWEEDFMISDQSEIDWTVVNHSTSSQQWEFNGLRAQIYTIEEGLQPAVWSTMTSPAIDCSGQESVLLYVNQSLMHDVYYNNYFGKIEVSTDGTTWQQVVILEGNQMREEKFGIGLPYYEYDISAIADNQSQLFIRCEFNSNGDSYLSWDIDKIGLKSLNLSGSVPEAAVLFAPQNGSNVAFESTYIEWGMGQGGQPDGYRVYLDQNNPPSTLIYDGPNTYHYVENLELNKEYFWMVVPYNAEGDAADVPVWSFTTWNFQMFWEEDFMISDPSEINWTVVNHTSSSQQWEFNGLRAQIYTLDDELQTPVWSTMTSPAIDCSGQESVLLYVNQSLFHDVDFENYYGKIEVSTDGTTWQQAAIIDGNQYRAEKFGFGLPYFEYDISAIADNQPQLFIRVEFNSNGDWNLGWDIDKIGLKGLVSETPAPPAPAVLVAPGNGYNIDPETRHLEWTPGEGPTPTGYKVYLDENNPPQNLVYEGVETIFQPELEAEKDYFWMVVPYNEEGETTDAVVWSFSTYNLVNIWEEEFINTGVIQPEWSVENLGSGNQWTFPGETASIQTPFEKAPAWSTMTSNAIDCNGYENIRLYTYHTLYHDTDFDSYYGNIEVSVDGETWQQVVIYEGDLKSQKLTADHLSEITHTYFEYNISHIADGYSQIWIRYEFNSNMDSNINWEVDKVGLLAAPAQGVPSPAINPRPEDGQNVPFHSNFTWNIGEGPVPEGFKVYLDETYPPETLVYEGVYPTFDHIVDNNKEYFWKVVPFNSQGEAENVPVWSFTTYELAYFWEESFDIVDDILPDWTIENLSGSDNQWEFNGYYVEISSPLQGDAQVWSTITSQPIDCSAYENIHFTANHAIYHANDFDSYYAKIEISTDSINWVEVLNYQGDLEGNGFTVYFDKTINISEFADNQPQLWIRADFNSNGDKDLEWNLNQFMLSASNLALEPVILVAPADGSTDHDLQVELIWQPGQGATPEGYRLYVDTNNPPQHMAYDGVFSAVMAENLEYNTTYYWSVVPYRSDSESPEAQVWSFTTRQDPTVQVVEPEYNQFSIFPNPSNAIINIKGGSEISEIRMFNMVGQLVYSARIGDNNTQIDVSSFGKGIYLMQITTTRGVSTHKVKVTE